MPKTHCPYLTNWSAHGQQVAPIDYPSFENHCVGQDENSSLLLTDQATYCLSGSHRFCPIYTALAAEEGLAEQAAPHTAANPPQRPAQWVPFQRPTPPHVSRTAHTRAVERDAAADPAFAVNPLDAPHFTDTPHFTENIVAEFDADLPAMSEGLPDVQWGLPSARWWAWAGAILLFFAVIGTGSLIAAYAGWQLAIDRLATASSGQINTLDNAAAPLQPQVQPLYIVMTATSAPDAVAQGALGQEQEALPAVQPRTGQGIKPEPVTGVDAPTPAREAAGEFPVAVTPTAVIVVPLPTPVANENAAPANPLPTAVPPTATPVPIQLPPAADAPTSVINVQVEIPTRRATPVFDIPTSTPAPETVEPTPTNTLVPILGTPVVVFAADQSAVPPGKCTRVRWRVENVREVYYENLPMFGMGDRQECLDEDPDTFALTVVFADGQTRIYTTTVGIVWPTSTPSVTPSFTPEIVPTQTWTPPPPTSTPTPNVIYGTTLEINGENPTRCRAGETCTIDVLATNTGDSIDTLAIELVSTGDWPALLCSQIGTCGSPRLVVANVGPANTVFVNLQITIPADSAGQSTNYALRSLSEGSAGTISSQVTELTVTAHE